MKVYRFRVTPQRYPKVYRDIDISEEQTLMILHQAIQTAFEFADDHLYSFFVGGKRNDPDNEYKLSEILMDGINPKNLASKPPVGMSSMTDDEFRRHYFEVMTGKKEVADKEALRAEYIYRDQQRLLEGLKRDVTKTKLKSLKLRKGSKIFYLFDYGDEWHFDLQVQEVYSLPYVSASVGKAPAQYPDFDEED